MKQKLQVLTLGCSKNTVDTEHLLSCLEQSYDIVQEGREERADVFLINTCGFIGDAKEESIHAILAASERKKRGEIGRLAVFGCLSQRYGHELPELMPEVDAWFGARNFEPLLQWLGVDPSTVRTGRYLGESAHSYAFLKISEGCDRRCSYCAIPHIRGAHRSVPMESLVKEAEYLASRGVRELVLIAQDTTFYGLDLYNRRALADLLRKLSSVEGIEWLRIHYSYPADFPDDVLEEMASNPKVCKYLDIPLQHIADPVLEQMHRHVNGEWTRELVRRLRDKIPGVVLRTTMMVGHPGEGRKEFNELMDFVRDARFERLGAFSYSEEEGTWGADNLRDSVDKRTKARRLDSLMKLQREISLDFNMSRVGSVERVLVDAVMDDVLVCRSQYESPEVDGEILVERRDEIKVGDFVNVRIVGADEYDLAAVII